MLGDPTISLSKSTLWLVAGVMGLALPTLSSGCGLDSAGLLAEEETSGSAGGVGQGGAGSAGSGAGGELVGASGGGGPGAGGGGGSGLPPVEARLPVSDDTYLEKINANANFGATNYLRLHFYSRPIMRFDVAAIPTGAKVVSAKLSLFIEGIDPAANQQELRVHEILSGDMDWRQGSGNGTAAAAGEPCWVFKDGGAMVNWKGDQGLDTPGVDYKATPEDGITTTFQADTRYEWQISPALVQTWVDKPALNHGLTLRTATGYHYLISSAESSQEQRRPALVVRYQPPAPP